MFIIDFLIGPKPVDFDDEEKSSLTTHTTLCKTRYVMLFSAFRRLGIVIWGILLLQLVVIGIKIRTGGGSEPMTITVPLQGEVTEVCERKHPEVCYSLISKDFYVILSPEDGYTQATNTGDIDPPQ